MGLGVCCRLALGRLPLKAYMKKEGGQSVASSHRVNPGMRLRDNPSWSHQVFLSYPAMLAVTAGRGIAMGFPMEISFLCETHWVPSASPRCLLQELEQVLKWGTTGGGSSGPGVTPEGPGKAITGGWIPASLGVWKPFSREVTPHPCPSPLSICRIRHWSSSGGQRLPFFSLGDLCHSLVNIDRSTHTLEGSSQRRQGWDSLDLPLPYSLILVTVTAHWKLRPRSGHSMAPFPLCSNPLPHAADCPFKAWQSATRVTS